MVNVRSPQTPLTVHLPADLIEELRVLARQKNVSVDEVVMEACLSYTEPYAWERTHKEWRQAHADEPARQFGIDGDESAPPAANEGRS